MPYLDLGMSVIVDAFPLVVPVPRMLDVPASFSLSWRGLCPWTRVWRVHCYRGHLGGVVATFIGMYAAISQVACPWTSLVQRWIARLSSCTRVRD